MNNSKIRPATGAAVAPPPPPNSTSTVTTIRGSSRGAKPENQEWVFDLLAGLGQSRGALPAHRLGRAGLAADVETVDAGALARAAVVDRPPHAVDDRLEGRCA